LLSLPEQFEPLELHRLVCCASVGWSPHYLGPANNCEQRLGVRNVSKQRHHYNDSWVISFKSLFLLDCLLASSSLTHLLLLEQVISEIFRKLFNCPTVLSQPFRCQVVASVIMHDLPVYSGRIADFVVLPSRFC